MKLILKWRTLPVVLLLGLTLVSCQKKEGGDSSSAATGDLKTDEEKAFYSLGVMFGGRLKEIDLTEAELNKVVLGLKDSATGKKAQVDVVEFRGKIDTIFKERIDKAVVKAKEVGKTHIENFVKEGAQKTASGLAYKIEKKGDGRVPKPEDTVEVHYKGTLIDGTVFDSSYDRNKTINFPLNRVIPGWTEGLQLIGEGGKIKLAIPSDLAYGDRGAPPNVPGGSTLLFEVELFKVSDTAPEGNPLAKAGDKKAAAPAAPKEAKKKK